MMVRQTFPLCDSLLYQYWKLYIIYVTSIIPNAYFHIIQSVFIDYVINLYWSLYFFILQFYLYWCFACMCSVSHVCVHCPWRSKGQNESHGQVLVIEGGYFVWFSFESTFSGLAHGQAVSSWLMIWVAYMGPTW